MFLESVEQKDVVCLATAQKYNGFALVLPVPWILGIRLNTILVFHRFLLLIWFGTHCFILCPACLSIAPSYLTTILNTDVPSNDE